MTKPINIYLIFYQGDMTRMWDQPAMDFITHMVNDLQGSSYWDMTTKYYSNDGYVSSNIRVAQSIVVNGSRYSGRVADTRGLVFNNLAPQGGALPVDENGIYVVVPKAGSLSTNYWPGLCNYYCGYHSYFTTGYAGATKAIKFALVGDGAEDGCNFRCGWPSLNENIMWMIDPLLSVLAHEVIETATDPMLNAWKQYGSGEENSDLCNWNFGDFTPLNSGGTRLYSLQTQLKLWARVPGTENGWYGYCTME